MGSMAQAGGRALCGALLLRSRAVQGRNGGEVREGVNGYVVNVAKAKEKQYVWELVERSRSTRTLTAVSIKQPCRE
jgi:hypothetical protein